jgi:hypothetical protein
MASQVRDTAWLQWVAGLLGTAWRQTHTSTLPPDLFFCLLDELPLHLIPQPFLASVHRRRLVHGPVYLNPDCTIQSAEEFPVELAGHEELADGFARQGSIAWVGDSLNRFPAPFWLGPRLEKTVRNLPVNEPVSLAEHERFLLAAAGIVMPEDRVSAPGSGNDGVLARARASFREKSYVALRGIIHPFQVAALRRYFRYQLRHGAFQLGDRDNRRRYVAKNEPVARFFHHQLTHLVSAIAGQAVKPSYVYFASYLSGAELIKHTDRPQCEFSITLCLDFSPEPALATSWPIRLETPKGMVVVYQALGDGLVYRGPQVPHYRTPLKHGQTSTSIFFHYVADDFEGPLD